MKTNIVICDDHITVDDLLTPYTTTTATATCDGKSYIITYTTTQRTQRWQQGSSHWPTIYNHIRSHVDNLLDVMLQTQQTQAEADITWYYDNADINVLQMQYNMSVHIQATAATADARTNNVVDAPTTQRVDAIRKVMDVIANHKRTQDAKESYNVQG